MNLNSEDVVLVTGGAGFLGQHVVKQLLLDTPVRKVIIFDKHSSLTRDDFDDVHVRGKHVVTIVGDICNLSEVIAAFKGVSAVIHCAALVDFRLFPDRDAISNVNVKGTKNLIESCIENNVSRLVFTSTIDVVVGDMVIENGDEMMLQFPDRCLVHEYGHSKQEAERMVIAANGTPLATGTEKGLRTICLRPSVMYGEGDPYLIPTALNSANQLGGRLVRIGDGKSLSQYAYVGNVAHAHISALNALSSSVSANQISGSSYFVNDDTPIMNSFDFFTLFLKPCGKSVTSLRIPYSIIYLVMFLMEFLMSIIRLFYPVNFSYTLASIIYVNRTVYFSRARAEHAFGYVPKFSFNASFEKSVNFYVKLTR